MKITVSHSGKQHAYRHAQSVQQLGCLHRFVTSTYYRRDCWPDRIVSTVPKLGRALQKRTLQGLDSSKVIRNLRFEIPELWQRIILKNGSAAERAMFQRDARFDRWVAKRYAGQSDLLWGFQGSCLESLKAAKAAGQLAVCEFATAHVTAAIRILSAEIEKHPEWAGTISNLNFPDWYRERLEQEPLEADFCIAASTFTKESLQEVGVAEKKICTLPLASDVDQFAFAQRKNSGPLKVLFVGGIGQRKGIKYLLQAIKKLNSPSIQLQLLGPMPADETPLKKWSKWFDYLGQTDQNGVVKKMQQADLLVLPSVFEGFGLVIVEAMATGMPVIASTHSCGPEVIREGTDGFVLRPDDVDGLTKKISWCAENRTHLLEMGRAAYERAQEFSWMAHERRLAALLEQIPIKHN